MSSSIRQTELAGKIDIVQLEPNVRPAFSDQIGQLANDVRVENRLALGGIKNRQRHAPAALTRDHPIGARFNRAGDSVLAPGRDPLDLLVNGVKCLTAQLIDTNKKLLDVAEDDRRLR